MQKLLVLSIVLISFIQDSQAYSSTNITFTEAGGIINDDQRVSFSLSSLFKKSGQDIKSEYFELNQIQNTTKNPSARVDLWRYYDSNLQNQSIVTQPQSYKHKNANYVRIPAFKKASIDKRKAIIGVEAPRNDEDREEFWTMVAQNKVSKIITFVESFVEMPNHNDIMRYYPGDNEDNNKLEFGEYTVVHEIDQFQGSEHLDIRVLKITKNDGSSSQILSHYHFKSWEDFGVPCQASQWEFKNLIESTANHIINTQAALDDSIPWVPEKVLVHCRAGLGRTGTFISLLNSVISIKIQKIQLEQEGKKADNCNIFLNPFTIVQNLREQRRGAVETPQQYSFIYSFLSNFFTF